MIDIFNKLELNKKKTSLPIKHWQKSYTSKGKYTDGPHMHENCLTSFIIKDMQTKTTMR